MTTKEKNQLFTEYPFILLWGKKMGSFEYFIVNQILEAKDDNAPFDSIYKNYEGVWVTATPEIKIELDKYKNRLIAG